MKKAVLINDSKFENLILQDMLSKQGYEVEIGSEFDALYEVEQFEPDLVIVNYVMQETTGDVLIRKIKTQSPNTVCLLSSSSGIHKSEFPHVDGILRTPVSMFTLQDLLGRINSEKDNINQEKIEKPTVKVVENDFTDSRFCPGCDRDISAFGDMIVFCPFCGEGLV